MRGECFSFSLVIAGGRTEISFNTEERFKTGVYCLEELSVVFRIVAISQNDHDLATNMSMNFPVMISSYTIR